MKREACEGLPIIVGYDGYTIFKLRRRRSEPVRGSKRGSKEKQKEQVQGMQKGKASFSRPYLEERPDKAPVDLTKVWLTLVSIMVRKRRAQRGRKKRFFCK